MCKTVGISEQLRNCSICLVTYCFNMCSKLFCPQYELQPLAQLGVENATVYKEDVKLHATLDYFNEQFDDMLAAKAMLYRDGVSFTYYSNTGAYTTIIIITRRQGLNFLEHSDFRCNDFYWKCENRNIQDDRRRPSWMWSPHQRCVRYPSFNVLWAHILLHFALHANAKIGKSKLRLAAILDLIPTPEVYYMSNLLSPVGPNFAAFCSMGHRFRDKQEYQEIQNGHRGRIRSFFTMSPSGIHSSGPFVYCEFKLKVTDISTVHRSVKLLPSAVIRRLSVRPSVCPSGGPAVRPSVRPSVRLSVTKRITKLLARIVTKVGQEVGWPSTPGRFFSEFWFWRFWWFGRHFLVEIGRLWT